MYRYIEIDFKTQVKSNRPQVSHHTQCIPGTHGMVIYSGAEEILCLVDGGSSAVCVTGQLAEEGLHLVHPVQPVSDSGFTGQPLQTPLHSQGIVTLCVCV